MEKLAVISGASSGIGEACIKTFGEAGYNLVLIARSKDKLFELCEQAKRDYQVSAQMCVTDLESESDSARLVAVLKEDYPTIDVFVHAAGLFVETNLEDSPEKLLRDYEHARKIMLDAPIYLTLQLKDIVKKMIYVTSNAGLEKKVYFNQGVYGGVKAGLNHFVRSLAKDAPGRFYAIAPGNVDTPLLRKAVEDEEVKKAVLDKYESLETFWRETLSASQVAETILDVVNRPKSYQAITEMRSSEF